MATAVDTQELEAKVKTMYRHVAEEPQGDYHFELAARWPSASATQPMCWTESPRARSSRSPAWATSSTSPGCTTA